MNTKDALSILQVKTDLPDKKALKSYYHGMAKQYHSDMANVKSDSMMQLINEAYNFLIDKLPLTINDHINQAKEHIFVSDLIEKALSAVSHLPLIFELCGTWVWVTGNTKEYKDILREAGFRWSFKKKAWHFSPPQEKGKYNYRGKRSLDEIRTRYGSQNLNTTNKRRALA